MKKVLVTGADGQLGLCIRRVSEAYPDLDFVFTDLGQLNITDRNEVISSFEEHKPQYCVNCAAYTAVDKAELEPQLAFSINSEGVKNIVEASMANETVLIQISTDFVFNGSSPVPYKETDSPAPINTYGKSKYEAERVVISSMERYFIIRTAWVYSEFGNNFLKTMIRLGRERDSVSVVRDQFGSPTYAMDLASFILCMIDSESKEFGIFNYTNQGITSWFEFAREILKVTYPEVEVLPIKSEEYKSAALRPKHSALDLSKTKQTFDVDISEWQESLATCLKQIQLFDGKASGG